MSANLNPKIAELLKPMLKRKLFIALNRALVSSEEMSPYVADHLEYMNELESSGKLFASGPFIQEGILVGDGLTILNTSTLDEARALMLEEPLVKRGLREFQLHTWELREGRMTVRLNASATNFELL
jgi:uncharacterized protein